MDIQRNIKDLERRTSSIEAQGTPVDINAGTTLTIAAGVLSLEIHPFPQTIFRKVATEASAASDDLDTINNGVAGDVLILVNDGTGDVPTIKDGTGNIRSAGDFALGTDDSISLVCDGTNWIELSRSSN